MPADYSRVSLWVDWPHQTLAVGAFETTYNIYRIDIKPISGQVKPAKDK